jgi:hypothetical protein
MGLLRALWRRPTETLIGGTVVVLLGISAVVAAANSVLVWWAGLPILQRSVMVLVGGIVGVGLVDRVTASVIGLSPIKGVTSVALLAKNGILPNPSTGRPKFDTGRIEALKRGISPSQDGEVPTNQVFKSDAETAQPVVDRGTSIGLSGQTGTGKSKTAKAQLQSWGYDEPVMAHGLVQPANESNPDPAVPTGTTEWLDFFEDEGLNVEKMGPENSSVRWNPFLDMREDMRDFADLARALYRDSAAVETGYDEAGRALLQAILVLTDGMYGDFARVGDVFDEYSTAEIIHEVEQLPNGQRATYSLQNQDDEFLGKVSGRVNNRISNILLCDICDASIPEMSLREFFAGSGADALTLENRTDEGYASKFWSFLISESVDITMNSAGKNQILVDEVDKLPKIRNFGDLASAGRSANARGIFIMQGSSQLEQVYGENGAKTIWEQCPNTFAFCPGSEESAEFALSSIGKEEMDSARVSSDPHELGKDRVSQGRNAKKPLLTGDLMKQQTGEALVQSEKGWWLADLKEPKL